jgi:ankyrin repeat protein
MNSLFEQLLLNGELFQAAGNGDTTLVESLLEQGAEMNAVCYCALRAAAKNGHTETVALLLDRGADIRAVHDIALRSAVNLEYSETVALLLSRYKTGELQSLQGTMQMDLVGANKVLPLVRTEIARRFVRNALADQPTLEV